MGQLMTQAKDIYYDTDVTKPNAVRKLGAAYSHFFATARLGSFLFVWFLFNAFLINVPKEKS